MRAVSREFCWDGQVLFGARLAMRNVYAAVEEDGPREVVQCMDRRRHDVCLVFAVKRVEQQRRCRSGRRLGTRRCTWWMRDGSSGIGVPGKYAWGPGSGAGLWESSGDDQRSGCAIRFSGERRAVISNGDWGNGEKRTSSLWGGGTSVKIRIRIEFGGGGAGVAGAVRR